MGSLSNLLITMTIISMVVLAGNVYLNVDTLGDTFINKFLNGYSTSKVTIDQDLDNSFDKTISQAESGSFVYYMGIIDGLKKVFAWLINIIGLGFSLFNLLVQTGAPLIICSLFGIPVGVAYYLAILGVIRGIDL